MRNGIGLDGKRGRTGVERGRTGGIGVGLDGEWDRTGGNGVELGADAEVFMKSDILIYA